MAEKFHAMVLMRTLGFSTGAVAFGDFAKGLELALAAGTAGRAVVELSALRAPELEPLLDALPALDLGGFQYVSLHAPSQFDPTDGDMKDEIERAQRALPNVAKERHRSAPAVAAHAH